MTDPAPPDAVADREARTLELPGKVLVGRAPGRLTRARILQPCRFYLYGWGLLLLLALALVGFAAGEWQAPALAAVALLFMVPAVEAAARSTLAPADVVRMLTPADR